MQAADTQVDAPRSGGVDGQGGFPAILHPQETVVDHTDPSSMRDFNEYVRPASWAI